MLKNGVRKNLGILNGKEHQEAMHQLPLLRVRSSRLFKRRGMKIKTIALWSGRCANHSLILLKRESDSMSCTTSSYSSCLTSPVDVSHDNTEISVVKRRQWSEASQQNRDSAIFDLGLDLEAAWREEAVGLAVQLHHYAQDTWQAPTPRAQAIKQVIVHLNFFSTCLQYFFFPFLRHILNWSV